MPENKKTRGGARAGAGRPKLEASKYREILIRKIEKQAEPLAQALIDKGLTGDVPALKEIHDRALGKAKESVDLTSNGETIGFIALPPLKEDA